MHKVLRIGIKDLDPSNPIDRAGRSHYFLSRRCPMEWRVLQYGHVSECHEENVAQMRAKWKEIFFAKILRQIRPIFFK